MEEKEKIIIFFIILILIALIGWNFLLGSTNKTLNKKIDEINENINLIFESIDRRLNNVLNYQVSLWLEKNNLTDFEWMPQLNCSQYKPFIDTLVYSINNDSVSVKMIVDDDKFSVVYHKNGNLICYKSGNEIDCKEVFCDEKSLETKLI